MGRKIMSNIDEAISSLEEVKDVLEEEAETKDLTLADIGIKMVHMSVVSDIETLKEHKADDES